MLNKIFRDTITHSKSIVGSEYLRENLEKQVIKLMEYYRNRESDVYNNHILVKLLKKINIDPYLDIFTFLPLYENTVKRESSMVGIFSNVNKGKVIENGILGDGYQEVFMFNRNDIDYFNTDSFLDISAIKIHYGEFDNIITTLPTEKINTNLDSLVIYTIDPLLLALQYREWFISRNRYNLEVSYNRFVYQVVLSNLIKEFTVYSIWNRILNIHYGIESEEVKPNNPIHVSLHMNKIDKYYDSVLKNVSNKSDVLTKTLENIPLPFGNVSRLLASGMGMLHSNLEWIHWYAVLSHVDDVLSIIGDRGFKRNKDRINRLRFYIREFRNKYDMEDYLGGDILDVYNSALDIVEAQIK